MEDNYLAFARISGLDPSGIVQREEFLVRGCACTVILWITPSVDEIALGSRRSVDPRLRVAVIGCTVVDHVKLAHEGRAHDDLVEFRIIGDGVEMEPVLFAVGCYLVDIEEPGIVNVGANRPAVGDAAINAGQMVPDVPFP